MTKLQCCYSWELLNSFLSNFDCFSILVLTRWNYSCLFQADRRSLWYMKFSKHTTPFHITYELGQMTEIPLGMHPKTICIEKFHAKTVSILLFLMFEKCGFCENYPTMDWKNIIMLFPYHNEMETGLKLEEGNFYAVILWRDIYKSLRSLLASKNIIKHTFPKSLRLSTTMDTKVHCQTSATLNQSELQFKSSANCEKIVRSVSYFW